MDALFVWYVWLAVALITLILEVFTSGFVIGCFSVGALVSAIVAVLGGGMNAQLIVFAAVTVGVFAFIRPFALKYLLRARNRVATNNDALIGRTGQVVTAIDNAAMRGEVRVDGDIFPARSHSGAAIPSGCDVRIVALESITLIVEPLEGSSQA